MREVIRLNNEWRFVKNYKESMERSNPLEGFEIVNLPHTNVELPFNYFDEKDFQIVSCYQKSFAIDKSKKDKVAVIRFEGVMTYAKVYVNGVFVGEHKGGYTPFEFDITEHIEYDAENILTVVADATERDDIPPFGGQIDYLTYGGIYREVSLTLYDKVYINNVQIKTKKVLEDIKALEIDLYTTNQLSEILDAKVNITIETCDGEKVYENSASIVCNVGNNKYTLEFDNIKYVDLWHIDNPSLYTVNLTLETESTTDTFQSRIGFRTCEFTSKGFLLNGKKLKIVALNRHQSFPYVGYAMPKRVQEKDADILKDELHLNLVRTSHYPQSVHFINRCDEIGLLVFEEIPGWQHIGNEEWKDVAVENVKEMVERDWNHPSIILWGVRINESPDDDTFYKRTNEMARSLDDTRQTGGVRCIENSTFLEDVYTMNDFSHCGEDLVLKPQQEITHLDKDVPYMVTEYNGHMYPTKKNDNEERQMEHVLRHTRVQNISQERDNVCGAIGWCAFDYNTHKDFGAGDRICYHGVMDMFRIKKFASDVYASMVSPEIEPILQPVTYWARGERSIGGILPLVILTNCDYVKFTFGDLPCKKLYPSKDKFIGLKHPPIIVDTTMITPSEIGEWGLKWEDGIFAGYVDDKKVIEKKFAKDPVLDSLEVTADDYELESKEKDATRIVIKALDQAGNVLPFCDEIIKVNVKGVGKIQGPDTFALKGGSIAFWVETINKAGNIDIEISSTKFTSTNLRIIIK